MYTINIYTKKKKILKKYIYIAIIKERYYV